MSKALVRGQADATIRTAHDKIEYLEYFEYLPYAGYIQHRRSLIALPHCVD
jgi:hypothetical protein